jgi:ssDNA-binding Zn-finger/Zn-ribbon topoisomerase 1
VLVVKEGRRGQFMGCPGLPKCGYSESLLPKVTADTYAMASSDDELPPPFGNEEAPAPTPAWAKLVEALLSRLGDTTPLLHEANTLIPFLDRPGVTRLRAAVAVRLGGEHPPFTHPVDWSNEYVSCPQCEQRFGGITVLDPEMDVGMRAYLFGPGWQECRDRIWRPDPRTGRYALEFGYVSRPGPAKLEVAEILPPYLARASGDPQGRSLILAECPRCLRSDQRCNVVPMVIRGCWTVTEL